MTFAQSLYGRDEFVVVSAVRYAIGRQTYIVADTVEWLLHVWPALATSTQQQIRRDVEAAFDHGHLGADIDRQQWERVRALWRA